MGIFDKINFVFKSNKKSKDLYLPAFQEPLVVVNDCVKCKAVPIKTIATFDLNIEKPRYEGEIPEATIKFYPLD